jgi:hypothetical protein
VDLSSKDKRSAACLVEWSDGRAEVRELSVGVTDSVITRLIGEADKVGIDVPLGWPIAFAEAMRRHSEDGAWPETYRHADMAAYRFRRTDLHVHEISGVWPLSVSTDRIAIPAMRAAAVLAAISPSVARDGSGAVVEVYPAVALKQWGFPWRGYKGPERTGARSELVASFLAETALWLNLSAGETALCEASDDAFDSLIAALVARAAELGTVQEIPEADQAAALREGWIAVPRAGTLGDLVRPR